MIQLNDEITQISKIISNNFSINKIILFGSYANGTNTSESDIDICLLTDESTKKIEVAREIRKALYDNISKPLDLLIYKTDDFYERADTLQSIEKEIKNHGVFLYG